MRTTSSEEAFVTRSIELNMRELENLRMWSQIDCLGIADLYGCCAGYVLGCCWETGPDPVDVNRRLFARCCLATIGTEASGRSDRSDELD